MEEPFYSLCTAVLLLQAQENILALNGSRMRALQELKVANEKIAELEQKLEDAVAQISNLQERRLDPAAGEPPAQGAPAGSQLCLIYSTGWDTAYVHYQLDDKRKYIMLERKFAAYFVFNNVFFRKESPRHSCVLQHGLPSQER